MRFGILEFWNLGSAALLPALFSQLTAVSVWLLVPPVHDLDFSGVVPPLLVLMIGESYR